MRKVDIYLIARVRKSTGMSMPVEIASGQRFFTLGEGDNLSDRLPHTQATTLFIV